MVNNVAYFCIFNLKNIMENLNLKPRLSDLVLETSGLGLGSFLTELDLVLFILRGLGLRLDNEL